MHSASRTRHIGLKLGTSPFHLAQQCAAETHCMAFTHRSLVSLARAFTSCLLSRSLARVLFRVLPAAAPPVLFVAVAMTHLTPLPTPFPGPSPAVALAISVSTVRSTAKQLLEDHMWPEPIYYGSRTLRAVRAAWPYVVRSAMLAATLYGMYLLYRRRLRRARQKNVERSYQLFGEAVRFGLDIGGTLCKVVYFEPEVTATQSQTALKARVSAFIRRSNSYGVTGHRDGDLEVLLNPIRGTLHFLKFQTSMMPNFITIVKENELSPQRPLKDGGGTDDVGEEEETAVALAARRNNVGGHHHHHHHVHAHQAHMQLVHPQQMNRSYSAAWRSDDEHKQQHLNTLHPLPHSSATPTTDVVSQPTGFPHTAANLANDPLQLAAEQDHSPAVSDSTVASSASSHTNTSSSPVAPVPTSSPLHFSSSSPTIIATALPTRDTHAPLSTASAATTASNSSRATTPPATECPSISCPSSPLAGSTQQMAALLASQSAAAAAPEPRTGAFADSTQALLRHNNRDLLLPPPKRVIRRSPPTPIPPSVCATGGGAFKFERLFRDELHITLHKEDELRALVKGIDFMIHSCADECYYLSHYRFREPIQRAIYPSSSISYPYLVVNIGSGVSILKVTGPSSYVRVGGTSLGGGTFYGLCRALTGCTSFDEALQLAEAGRSGTADLLVGDIYGGAYDELGLAADAVASSFGKLVRGDALKDVSKADLAKAALVMITNNIGPGRHTTATRETRISL